MLLSIAHVILLYLYLVSEIISVTCLITSHILEMSRDKYR